MSCFNRFRFLAEVSTNLQKMHYFGQFKDHNSGKQKGNYTNDPIFPSTFWEPTVCDIHFCVWKFKIHFHRIHPLIHSGLQNTWILGVKIVRSEFFPVRFSKHTLKKTKNRVFLFLSSWELNLTYPMVYV